METQDQVAILKQINRVNDDGSYTFGYEAADGSFKIETRDVKGNVKGMFGFINENGELKRVSYSASNGTGFQSTGTLNVPPLVDTSIAFEEGRNRGYERSAYSQLIRPQQSADSSTRISLLESSTPSYDPSQDIPPPRLPIYIFGSSTPSNIVSSIKPPVIQHIPRTRPTSGSISTIPTESEEILRKPLLYPEFVAQRTSNSNYISFDTNDISSTTETKPVTEENKENESVIQVIRPRPSSLKKPSRRPVASTTPKVVTTTEYKSKNYLERLKNKSYLDGRNGLRRQLNGRNKDQTSTPPTLMTSGTEDSPDVYGGGHTSRPYPTNAYRALFSQIPHHQRILQNSYIQNQNQYLAAAFGNSGGIPTPPQIIHPILQQPVPSTIPQIVTPTTPHAVPSSIPQIVSTAIPGVLPANIPQAVSPTPQSPNQARTYTGAPSSPQEVNTSPPTNNYVPSSTPQPIANPQGPTHFPPTIVPQLPPNASPVLSPYPQDHISNQIYIPPPLLDHIIRMLIAVQQRQRQQGYGQFQPGVQSSQPSGSPELSVNPYDPRYYQQSAPFPNYSQAPGPYPVPTPSISRPGYENQYPFPYYQAFVPVESRLGFISQTPSPIPYTRYQSTPYDIDPVRQQQNEDLRLRMLAGYPRFPPPVPGIPTEGNVVERSPVYQPTRDSTTSSTTRPPRLGSVRNVEILGSINDDGITTRSYESSTKSAE